MPTVTSSATKLPTTPPTISPVQTSSMVPAETTLPTSMLNSNKNVMLMFVEHIHLIAKHHASHCKI